jgi:Uma2 family endonuclease
MAQMEKVAEAQEVGKPEHKKVTLQEYLKDYEGVYAEWIGGEVIVYPVSNNTMHQLILVFLTKLLGLYLDFRALGRLLIAGSPMVVHEEQSARQPDLMIILNAHLDRIKAQNVEGPADIVIEIVSPESGGRDRGDKFIEYEAAGVAEYWLLDPVRKEAVIYALGEDKRYHRAALDTQGRLVSTLLPGFALDPAILWREDMPGGADLLALVEAMKA